MKVVAVATVKAGAATAAIVVKTVVDVAEGATRTLYEAVRSNFNRRSNCAFAATMIVDRLIATAPTLIGRSRPQWTKIPAATGMATRL